MLARIGLAIGAFVLPALAQTVQLVSQSTGGVQGNGDSRAPRISADGNWVAFKSDASTLVAGDTNGVGDVFLRDLTNGTTILISVGLGGAPANGESFSPSISADGSVIAFQGGASNLVAGDTNGKADIFVWEAGAITRVSLGTGGVQADGASDKPSVSGDGRYVAFESLASNLVAGDANGTSDIFRFDRTTGSVVRASVSSTGAEANGASHAPWISDNGWAVSFDSTATNLVSGDTNGSSDVFVRNPGSGMTVSATVRPGLVGNGNSDTASLSADGVFVAFRSDATNLVASDTNGVGDVFLANPWSQQLWRVSEGTGSIQGNGAASYPQISADGQYVAFASAADNLIAGDTNNCDDVFVRDVAAANTKRISADAYGSAGNGHSRAPSVSRFGKSTTFKSDASNLISGDSNAIGDVFVRRPAAMTWYVDASATTPGDGSAAQPFKYLQAAFDDDLCVDGDTLLVLPGTYYGGFDMASKQVNVIGIGGPEQTILDGNDSDTVLSIPVLADMLIPIQVTGFTIQNGYAHGTSTYGCLPDHVTGGGVFIDQAVVTIEDCIVRDCIAEYGSAVGATNSVISMSECRIENNHTLYPQKGGAVWISWGASSSAISNCVVAGNAGAGVELCQGMLGVSASSISQNGGDGIAAAGSSVTVTGSELKENGRSGISVYDGLGVVNDCTFSGNEFAAVECGDWYGSVQMNGCNVTQNARALVMRPSNVATSHAVLGKTLVAENGSTTGAAAAFEVGGTFNRVIMDHCTLIANLGAVSGSFSGDIGSVEFFNGIAWGNDPPALDLSAAVISVEYSDVEWPQMGPGVMHVDPALWDLFGGDAHLLPGSPCIDAGDPNSPPDSDGSIADMGAIPFDPTYCGTPRVYCTAKVNSEGCMPSIAWTGTPSVAGPNDDFHITASNVLNNKNGILFWGTEDWGAPFQGGTLCVKPPIVRTGVQNSGGNPPPNDCSGVYDFHMSQAYMNQHLFQVGSTFYAQYWSRDPGFSPPNNVGLTDALRLVVCP